jgi:predicted transcriptional regulator
MSDNTSPLVVHPADNSDERIGRMVEVLLDLLGVTKQDLAKSIGLSPSGLGQRISGSRPWRSREVEQVAAALGFPLSVLYADPEDVAGALREGRSINYRKSA